MARYEFLIKGATPMLMHADNVERADFINAWRKDSKNKNITVPGDDRSPAFTWHAYLSDDGENVCVPSANLATCLRLAATQVSMKGKKTFKESFAAGVFFDDEYLTLTVGGDRVIPMAAILAENDAKNFDKQKALVDTLGFGLHICRAKIGAAKHIRVRPIFREWSLKGALDVMVPEIEESHINEFFQIGGTYKGLGDWRPSSPKSPGPYGKFMAEIKAI